MNTIEYLEAVKKKFNLESDYKLSQKLKVTRAAISKYRKKGTYLDNFTCYQVAEALEIEPQKVIIDIALEKERNEEKRNFWMEKLKEYGQAAILVLGILHFSALFQVADLSGNAAVHKQIMYIMLNC